MLGRGMGRMKRRGTSLLFAWMRWMARSFVVCEGTMEMHLAHEYLNVVPGLRWNEVKNSLGWCFDKKIEEEKEEGLKYAFNRNIVPKTKKATSVVIV